MSEERGRYIKSPTQAKIDELALWVRKELEGGTLYGEPVNIEDLNSLIVAAYLLGRVKQREDELAIQKMCQPRLMTREEVKKIWGIDCPDNRLLG